MHEFTRPPTRPLLLLSVHPFICPPIHLHPAAHPSRWAAVHVSIGRCVIAAAQECVDEIVAVLQESGRIERQQVLNALKHFERSATLPPIQMP